MNDEQAATLALVLFTCTKLLSNVLIALSEGEKDLARALTHEIDESIQSIIGEDE